MPRCYAWVSTGDPFLDLYANNHLTVESCLGSFEVFHQLVKSINQALCQNPTLFVKLVKYIRSIEQGKGGKLMYYLMMSIYRHHDLLMSSYPSVLEWSYQCKKDLLHLGHINFHPAQLPELQLYATHLHDLLEALLQDKPIEAGGLLWIKYINTGHFEKLSKLVWKRVNRFDMTQYHPTSADGQWIAQLLGSNGRITNKMTRQIKTHFHQQLHLLDDLYSDRFPDGTVMGTAGHFDQETLRVADLLGQCASKCGEKMRQTVKRYMMEQTHPVLVTGTSIYQSRIKMKLVKLNVHGLDLTEKCMTYFENHDYLIDEILEAQLREFTDQLKAEIGNVGQQHLNVIVDQSGSMKGKPLNSALFQPDVVGSSRS